MTESMIMFERFVDSYREPQTIILSWEWAFLTAVLTLVLESDLGAQGRSSVL